MLQLIIKNRINIVLVYCVSEMTAEKKQQMYETNIISNGQNSGINIIGKGDSRAIQTNKLIRNAE